MEMDPREREQRRQERKKAAKQREAQQRLLARRLALGGGVLVLVALVILIISLAGRSTSSGVTLPPESTLPPATNPTEGRETVITFTAAGDLCVTDRVVAAGGPGLDYTQMLSDVMPLLAEGDLTALNFEGNLVGPPYGTASKSAPSQLLQALAKTGVDMVQVANSCTISNGITGLNSTINAVRSVGLEPLGAYVSASAAEESGGYTIWEVRGVRVAVVAFTKGMDNMALPVGSEQCVNVLYNDYSSRYLDVNTEAITAILERVEKETPDVTIAMVHWGSEFNDTHSKSQLQIKDLLLEKGVDVIVGSHPHYVQAIEFNKDKGQLVAYSLGDFLGDGERMGTEYGIILNVQITKNNETGETKVTGYSYDPIFQCTDKNGRHRVLRVDSALRGYEEAFVDRVSDEVYAAMKNALERINARVKPE